MNWFQSFQIVQKGLRKFSPCSLRMSNAVRFTVVTRNIGRLLFVLFLSVCSVFLGAWSWWSSAPECGSTETKDLVTKIAHDKKILYNKSLLFVSGLSDLVSGGGTPEQIKTRNISQCEQTRTNSCASVSVVSPSDDDKCSRPHSYSEENIVRSCRTNLPSSEVYKFKKEYEDAKSSIRKACTPKNKFTPSRDCYDKQIARLDEKYAAQIDTLSSSCVDEARARMTRMREECLMEQEQQRERQSREHAECLQNAQRTYETCLNKAEAQYDNDTDSEKMLRVYNELFARTSYSLEDIRMLGKDPETNAVR